MLHHEKTNGANAFVIDQLSTDHKLDDVFEQYKSEIVGTINCLYVESESASRTAYEKLRIRCSRKYANSKIGDLRAWVFRMLYNAAIDDVGNTKPKRRKNDALPALELDAGTETNEDVLARVRRDFLKNALLELPFGVRAIFLLRQNGKMTYEQIARTTGFSFDKVKEQMVIAVEKLVEASDLFDMLLAERKTNLDSLPSEEVKE